MRTTQHGRVARPAVAVVGVWDPLLRSHETLLKRLRERASASGMASLVVLIDPDPGAFSPFAGRYGPFGWPVYSGVASRVGLMRSIGVDAVLRVRFRKRDFDATAVEFLDVVRSRVELGELWLGALQLLGPGRGGDRAAIEAYTTREGIGLTILPRAPVGSYDVRALLAAGRVRDAVAEVGRAPVWQRPRSGTTLRLAWQPGRYTAVALDRPEATPGRMDLEVRLQRQTRGRSTLSWPDRRIRYLAFTSGPADARP